MGDGTVICMECQSNADWQVSRFFVRVRDGFLCERCARSAAEQLERAERHHDAMVQVHRAMSHLLALAGPKEPAWLSESDPSRIDVLASQLDALAHDFVFRRGAFTADAETAAADIFPGLQLAIPATKVGPPNDATAAFSEQLREILDEPEDPEDREDDVAGEEPSSATPPKHGTIGVIAHAGEEPGSETPPTHGTIGVDSRAWVKQLAVWMRAVEMSPEALAERVKREPAFVEHVFTRTDRRTSLRLFLEFVRGAGARLCGVPESTPTALIARLKALTRQRRLTVATLADLTGIHRSQLSTLFNQVDPNPCLRTVDRIVTALGASAEMILVPTLDRVLHGAVAGSDVAQGDHHILQ